VLSHLTDDELIQLVQNKELDALKELYKRYERLTYSLAMKILGNTQEAEEVVQDVFMKVWNKSKLFDINKQTKFSSWIIRVCYNTAIDKLKKRKGYSHLDVEILESLPDISVDLDNELELMSLKNRVKEALKNLPNEQKEIIELMYFDGFSQSEIAEAMGIPLGTVKSRVRLALTKLKKLLNGEGVSPNGKNFART
jgi:RNA polymerase sigma factor (sigma-70 family)